MQEELRVRLTVGHPITYSNIAVIGLSRLAIRLHEIGDSLSVNGSAKVILRSFVTTYATLTKQVCRVRKQSTQLHNNGMEVRTDLDIN